MYLIAIMVWWKNLYLGAMYRLLSIQKTENDARTASGKKSRPRVIVQNMASLQESTKA